MTGNAAFTANNAGPFYFVLDNAVPEPSCPGLLGAGTCPPLVRRRRPA